MRAFLLLPMLAGCASTAEPEPPAYAVPAPLSAMSLETDCVAAVADATDNSQRALHVTAITPLETGVEVIVEAPAEVWVCRTGGGREPELSRR
ncbi:hypothetical protein [Pelagovum pacificum]|uniref:Uncharacterized protein n=1 Tax=Pelagovum pacificum TaxID=2588711 RepID=A0A5C5GGE6_9RHOB|nr:hypothetical protein [Pelagovum pacificum]QQA43041.1 hypothetical protein I8N54_00215 [Pelagovum pacificum]TNY33815.1 hypothetical protein FHY64_11300 [Pelagovum pacificum]